MEQIWRNPYDGDNSYAYVHAGSGCTTTVFPDGVEIEGPDLEFMLGLSHLFDWSVTGKGIERWFENLRNHPEAKNRLVIDCGAYSLWSIGKEFSIDKYIDWLNTDDRMDLIYFAVAVDKIPGTPKQPIVSDEEARAASEETWANYLRMIKEVKWPKKLAPVFHLAEDFRYLERMLEFTFEDGSHIPYICVTNHEGDINRCIRWYDKVFAAIKNSSNPNVKIHILQEGRAKILQRYKVQTSDASTAIRQSAFGSIEFRGKIVNVGRTIDRNYIDFQPQMIKDDMQKELDKIGHGLTLEHLKIDSGTGGNYRKIFSMMLKSEYLAEVCKKTVPFKEVKKATLW